MFTFRRICFLASIVLLLAAGADLLVDFVFPTACDEASVSGDDCFCCYTHIVVQIPPVMIPEEIALRRETAPAPRIASFEHSSIYHPPRI